jgi:Histidine phosphatase superfamily (branch 1)
MAMKSLHLLRHAKSSWKDPGLNDHDRPLSKRGRQTAKMMAAYLRRAKIAPDLVICSTAMRARQTLDPIAKAKKPPKVVLEREIYGGAQGALWEQLWNLPESAKSVLLIGHTRAGACPRRLEQAASVGRWKISDGCNGEFLLRWSMEGVGAARRCARLIYNTKDNCGIIPRSQGVRPAEVSVKSASRHRELTASSATQFRSRFSSAKSDAYKVHALVRILFAQPRSSVSWLIFPGL